MARAGRQGRRRRELEKRRQANSTRRCLPRKMARRAEGLPHPDGRARIAHGDRDDIQQATFPTSRPATTRTSSSARISRTRSTRTNRSRWSARPTAPGSSSATRCADPRNRADGRNRRAVEVRLPVLRRRGDLEPVETEARLPVLRHRVAGAARRRRHGRRARSRRGAARDRRRRARLAGGQASGQVPELQRDLGARSEAAGAELRVLRIGPARPLLRSPSRRSAPRACCRSP